MRVYYHARCFDGAISAGLACDLLGVNPLSVDLVPASYVSRDRWREEPGGEFAVVDFLFHPAARFWADHHASTFLDAAGKRNFEAGAPSGVTRLYDPTAASCAELLATKFPELVDSDEVAMRVFSASCSDLASYPSPREAVFGMEDWQVVSRSFGAAGSDEYGNWVVRQLARGTLGDLARMQPVRQHDAEVRRAATLEVNQVKITAVVSPNAVTYRTALVNGALRSRYAPYVVYPEVAYSIAIAVGDRVGKVTAMRNPWIEHPGPIDLGTLANSLGGGGHYRVGSVLVKPIAGEPSQALADRTVEVARRFADRIAAHA